MPREHMATNMAKAKRFVNTGEHSFQAALQEISDV